MDLAVIVDGHHTDDGLGLAVAVLLVPHVHRQRTRLLTSLQGWSAVVGPARPWPEAASSFRRALAAKAAVEVPGSEPLDADAHLVEIVLGADSDARSALRDQVLAPLVGLRPDTAERLSETLCSWLLHQGRRAAVADDLHVHAQTVRYRMNQLRDLYGDQLTDPRFALEAIAALAVQPRPAPSQARSTAGDDTEDRVKVTDWPS